MRSADAASVVAVKVLMEQYEILRTRVGLQHRIGRHHGPHAFCILEKERSDAPCEVVGNLAQRKTLARSCRIFDAKLIAVVAIELIQRFDQQVIDRYPDRPSPV